MTNIQPTMEKFDQTSNGTLDLRPEGHEQIAQKAQAKKEELLAQQAATSNRHPKGMDIKPAMNKGFNPVPGINSAPQGQANVFKLNENELEQPPVKISENADVEASQSTAEQNTPPSADMNANGPAQEQPKKPGFFGKLFGKK